MVWETSFNQSKSQTKKPTYFTKKKPARFSITQKQPTKHADCKENVLLSAEDFENDGHEPEILYRIGPISKTQIENLVSSN